MKFGACCLAMLALVSAGAGAQSFKPPAYADQERAARLQAALPELDKMYAELAEKEHLPGLVYGVVLDGKLVHARALGFANLERKLAAASSTEFRIASMTKSFVAMAALKLRDEGKLSLDDPVGKYLPELRRVTLPTGDSPAITVRHLMTMSTGLPEDNPWGDRQMARDNAALEKIIGAGLSFSNVPGQGFEYSNLGYVMLGKLVSKVAGMRFQDYITKQILLPLGMPNTRWEYTKVAPDKLALGYRWTGTGTGWALEPILPDGDGAAMGGLITTMDDFARYVAFHLDAWPARDGADKGPLRRASMREMHQPYSFTGLHPKTTLPEGATLDSTVSFYGYGLSWQRDSRDVTVIGHSGGLPGFGSQYRFAPHHGVGVIAFTNLRYGPVYMPTAKALTSLIERARLPARAQVASPILLKRQQEVAQLIQSWEPALAERVTAENFFLDRARVEWVELAGKQFAGIGKVLSVGAMKPQNQLRGSFPIVGEKGTLDVTFTLTPERDPKLQELDIKRQTPKKAP